MTILQRLSFLCKYFVIIITLVKDFVLNDADEMKNSVFSSRFDEYKMDSELYHGKKKLGLMSSTTCASVHTSGLVPAIFWDEW